MLMGHLLQVSCIILYSLRSIRSLQETGRAHTCVLKVGRPILAVYRFPKDSYSITFPCLSSPLESTGRSWACKGVAFCKCFVTKNWGGLKYLLLHVSSLLNFLPMSGSPNSICHARNAPSSSLPRSQWALHPWILVLVVTAKVPCIERVASLAQINFAFIHHLHTKITNYLKQEV